MKDCLRLLILLMLPLLLGACVDRKQLASQQQTTATPASAPPLSVALLASDLGYADGQFVREMDTVLSEAAKEHGWDYTLAGSLPVAETVQAGSVDVGLPWEDELQKGKPGQMRMDEALALFARVPPCDLLVLSTPYLLAEAERLQAAGSLKAGAILVADDQGPLPAPAEAAAGDAAVENAAAADGEDAAAAPAPVYHFSYQIKDLAFLCGVAAATSANNAQFLIISASDDPQAQDFIDGAAAGAEYTSAGSTSVTMTIEVDDEGLISPEVFSKALNQSMQAAGSWFKPNHFIISLGRTTPSIMHAFTKEPFSGYVVSGYGDYRVVRPARASGAAIKRPGVMLTHVLDEYAAGRPLGEIFAAGSLSMGLKEGALEMGDYEEYNKYNKDGQDISDAIQYARDLIVSGELLYEY